MSTRPLVSREPYEARLKARLDAEAGVDYARTEDREEGRVLGERIGIIQILENLWGMPQTAADELVKLPLEQFASRPTDLQRLFHERNR